MSILCFSACTQAQILPLTDYESLLISPASEESQEDTRWSTYLFNQLDKRTHHSGFVTSAIETKKRILEVVVSVNNGQTSDYQVVIQPHKITLLAKGEQEMIWLIYQFISKLGAEDKRVVVDDLPPAIIHIADRKGNFAFQYRGLYTPSNGNVEMLPITASNNMDYDWGLWGHNLDKVLNRNENPELFAWVDGKRNSKQYCFSSSLFYNLIETYVYDNWGDETKAKISITPNDNSLVCQCSRCIKLGNTKQSATPSVSVLIAKLAKRFPSHTFYLTAYSTTKQVPEMKMPPNVEVIISTLDLPMRIHLGTLKETATFLEYVNSWKKSVSSIYVWDYIRNFDDYLSPYPMLHIVKERVKFYQSVGIKGVIFNGSGNDYALFDDLQTYALQSLLIDSEVDLEMICRSYLERAYPYSHSLLYNYYSLLEERVVNRSLSLPFYGGIDGAAKGYLYPEEFETFYQQLDRLSKKIDSEERTKLNKMLTAMQFTRLELMRIPGTTYNKQAELEMLELLKGHTSFRDMSCFRESNGKIADYIEQRSNLTLVNSQEGNLLKGVKLHLVQAESENLSLLTDGYYGLPIDYHLGCYVSKYGELRVRIPHGNQANRLRLKIGLLQSTVWNHYLPESVEVWHGNSCLTSLKIEVADKENPFLRIMPELSFELKEMNEPIELRIKNRSIPLARTVIDEIEMYK
ncbi:MAG: DUF4838 domain-containing protein [Phocaeicola sp.]